jgi:hypothetical protein
MSNKLLEQILGKASGNAKPILQSTGTVTSNFIAFKPVNGDATFTSLTIADGTVLTSTTIKTQINTTGNFYQSEYYSIGGRGAVIATGEVLFYLGET